ncbi:excalibur calcium-binding domain-containing protein [Peribacillus frigoritolerans]|uniref:excalibur calcium-binding domain-containing protein n=1 Tax=Peribacillus frigoritolerans TaxID=450367 RepID=UPI00105A3B94|nr:excalibur calcium-binding domain-containing protein [Peribacillus frigoritolerans]TDL74961.1 hypothetical protein E2R53_22445 [Peribacillus frigoritolerans]
MKFLRVIALIIAVLFLLFCLVGSQRAWFGIIIFIIGLFLHKQYRKGRIQFSKSRYIITLGLLSGFILALTSPADTKPKPVKQTASEAKAADTAVKAEEEKAKEAEKKKEEAEAKKQAEQKRLEEEAKKQAEQKRLEEEAKKQAEQKRLEEERKKKEQEQAEAAAQEAERKRKEQEAAAAAAEPVQSTETFDNCTEMRKVHPKGVPSSHPAYESQHDRDKDNWACER